MDEYLKEENHISTNFDLLICKFKQFTLTWFLFYNNKSKNPHFSIQKCGFNSIYYSKAECAM